jgi:hypothetical protein
MDSNHFIINLLEFDDIFTHYYNLLKDNIELLFQTERDKILNHFKLILLKN